MSSVKINPSSSQAKGALSRRLSAYRTGGVREFIAGVPQSNLEARSPSDGGCQGPVHTNAAGKPSARSLVLLGLGELVRDHWKTSLENLQLEHAETNDGREKHGHKAAYTRCIDYLSRHSDAAPRKQGFGVLCERKRENLEAMRLGQAGRFRGT